MDWFESFHRYDYRKMLNRPGELKFTETQASVLLDLVRGVAALLVLLEHWRNAFFVDYPQLPSHDLVSTVFYVICSAGHQSVIIFFVLSGYLISGSVLRSFRNDTWTWPSYFTNRLTRLWVVLVPGLLLCALWDGIALRFNLAPAVYSGLGANHMTPNVHQTYTIQAFVGNIGFLQTILVPIFGSNGSLWSLANEFWYYVMFPLAAIGLRAKSKSATRLLCLSMFFLTAWFLRNSVLALFPVWLCGTALVLIPSAPIRRNILVFGAVVFVLALFVFAKLHPLPVLFEDYLFAVITSVFLWSIMSAKNRAPKNSSYVPFSRWLARFSYTLYVVHLPFLLLLTALSVGERRWIPTTWHLVVAVAVLVVTFLYAYLFAVGTEFRTDQVRTTIERKLGINKKTASE